MIYKFTIQPVFSGLECSSILLSRTCSKVVKKYKKLNIFGSYYFFAVICIPALSQLVLSGLRLCDSSNLKSNLIRFDSNLVLIGSRFDAKKEISMEKFTIEKFSMHILQIFFQIQ